MSDDRRRVKIADVFGSQEKEEAVTPLPRPIIDAIAYAERSGYGPLVSSRLTSDTLTLTFSNRRKATYRPDPRFLAVAFGSPRLAEVIERHGWSEPLKLSK